jgi:hypothetical protein
MVSMGAMAMYGMRLRGFSIGCQPMDGLIDRIDSDDKRYYDILIYSRVLTDKEVNDYELDYLGVYGEEK